ncbi:MAG: tetratricopeptide repeat protein [Cytophagales bacterium]|nr:tetratricopeptide repeat protein [Armatimonadota bacterium]
MARGTGLTSRSEAPTFWQKTAGSALAAQWSRKDAPPVSADKGGFYAAALAVGTLDSEARRRVARCLVWCDAARAAFDPARLSWYEDAFRAFPDDERCAFFAVALCHQQALTDSNLAMAAYRSVLRPEWRDSRYWNGFALPRNALQIALAVLYARESVPDSATAAMVESVVLALESAGESHPHRPDFVVFLGRVYQAQGRTDEAAETVYRWVLNHRTEDLENCRFLAALYLDRGRKDSNACAVYSRMAALAEENRDTGETGRWSLELARAYIEQGRMDEGVLTIYERASAFYPADPLIAAAHIATLSRQYAGIGIGTRSAALFSQDDTTLAKLEEAAAQEARWKPVFESNHWEWSQVLRALALAYGRQNRTDDTARALYARTIWACPEDPVIWALHARTLAEQKDHSEGALPVYEKAIHAPNCDDSVFVALGHAYISNHAEKDADRRHGALILWETLYRQGVHWPELVDALAHAYTGEERVNDIALSLWEKQIASSPKNGILRLKYAQEMRQRGDLHTALRYYKEAVKLLPRDFDALFETGQILKENYSDYPGSIKLLQKAVKLPKGQQHLEAHFSLAEALLFRDKRDEAKVLFQKIADEISPDHTPSLLHLARLNLKYEAEGVRQAEALYSQALTLNPENPETYRKMADLYHEKGQAEEEEHALEKYLMLSEPDAARYRQLADLYIRKGDFLRAESALRQVIALGQGDKRLYTLLGEVILQGRGSAAAA